MIENPNSGEDGVPEGTGPAAPQRQPGIWTTVVMLLLLALPALTQAVLDLRRGDEPFAVELVTTWPSRQAFRAMETQLEERSWVTRLARGPWTDWTENVLDRGSAQVVEGRWGWLFFRPSLRFVAGPDREAPSPVVEAIVDFHQQLESRGIRLLFVPVPTKPTVYPEKLSSRLEVPPSPTEAPNPRAVETLLASLRQAGVEVVDPLPALFDAKEAGIEVFLPRDTHWSWLGMQVVVRQVADRIGSFGEGLERVGFDHRAVDIEAYGDLDRMLHDRPGATTAPESRKTMQYPTVQVVGDRQGNSPLQESSPILVLGDSSALVFSEPSLGLGRRAGFAEHLANRLKTPVDRLATPAGGATRIRRLLALEPDRLASTRVVVWVLTQRDLRFADEGWHRVALPARSELSKDGGSEGASDAYPPLAGAVRAQVVAVSRAPVETAYADCLMIVRYQELAEPGRRFDVAHLGWQDFAPAPASRLSPGDTVDLDLTELPTQWRLDRTCWVDDVGLEAQPLWARNHAVQ